MQGLVGLLFYFESKCLAAKHGNLDLGTEGALARLDSDVQQVIQGFTRLDGIGSWPSCCYTTAAYLVKPLDHPLVSHINEIGDKQHFTFGQAVLCSRANRCGL